MTGINETLLKFAEGIIPNMGTATVIAVIASIALALFYCFFGYKLLRIHISFIMFMLGAGIGFTIAAMLNLENTMILVAVLVPAVILAVLGYFLYKVGVFVIAAVLVFFASYGFVRDIVKAQYVIVICIAAVILLAVLAVFFVRPVVIILTALSGGLIASNNLIDHFLTQVAQLNTPRVTESIVLALAGILAIFGMIYQFRSTENYEEKRARKRR